jgi:4-amino-4-deoxy-L-arabinose transferase-like glycosyltransferase
MREDQRSDAPAVRASGARTPAARDATHVHLLGHSGFATWTRSWRGGVLLVLLALLVLVPGLWQLPPFDRDEPRFAQASRQMLETGNWVVPFVQDRPRLNKPPLIYWLQAGTVAILTGSDTSKDAIWMYRLPGMLCTIGTVLLTWRLGRRLMDARAAWLGAALLAICPLVVVDAHQARSDQLLLFTVVLSQWALWRVLHVPEASATSPSESRLPLAALLTLGVILGISILAKGPIGPLIAGLTAATFALATRPWRGSPRWPLRAVAGTLLVAVVACLIVTPWVIAVANQVGFDRYAKIVFDETIGRSAAAKEGHALFPGVHTIALVGLFFPGSLLTGAAILAAIRNGFARPDTTTPSRWSSVWSGHTGTLFLLCWALPSWIVFEAISTRLVHYVMPLYPALALLSARVILRASAGAFTPMGERLTKIGFVIWAIVGAALTGIAPLSLAIFAFTNGHADHPTRTIVLAGVAGAACIALCIAGGFFALRGKPLRATLLGAIAMVVGLATLLASTLPNTRAIWPARNAIAAVRSIDPTITRPVGAIGFHEDSQIFLSHGRLVRLADDASLAWALDHPTALIIARRGEPSALALIDAGWTEATSAGGYNMNRGKWEDLVVLSRDQADATRREEPAP